MNRKANTVFLLCTILLMSIAALYCVVPAKAQVAIMLLATRGFYTGPPVGSGVYNVVGEIKNNGDMPAINVTLKVTFHDQDGKLLEDGTRQASVFINYILPGAKAPFRAAYNASAAGDVKQFRIDNSSISWKNPTQVKTSGLQILNSTYYYYQKDGWNYTVGTIKNNGATNATNSKVTVIYHNKTTGDIFWASRTAILAGTVISGEKASFEVNSYPSKIPSGKCNITVVAESDEYLSLLFNDAAQDTIKPRFGPIVWFPLSPTPDSITAVNVTVTKPDYAAKVTNVTLYYRQKDGSVQPPVQMKQYGDLWRSSIKPFGGGQIVEFWFEALDKAGNKQTSSYSSYTVQGQPSGVPLEILIAACVAVVLVGVVYRFRKKLF